MSDGIKEMLSVIQDGNQTVVKINYSSLELLQTCLRKSYYYFERKLVAKSVSPALVFGSAVHKAMEVWYASPPANRKAISNSCIDAHTDIAFGSDTPGATAPALLHGGCARCASIFAFVSGMSELTGLEHNDKRSVDNGIGILNDYFSANINDPFSIYSDSLGPCIERQVEFTLYDSANLKIIYFGTVDAIWQQHTTGKLYVVDHKTTSSLSQEFMIRHRPNFQYTGYLMGAKASLGIDTEAFIVNGIQVAKTVRGFRRIFTFRDDNDFQDLKNAVVHNVKRWLEAKHNALCSSDEIQQYIMNTPNPCTMYGGCQYHTICSGTNLTREATIRSQYNETISDTKNV